LDKAVEETRTLEEQEEAYERFVWGNLRRNYAGHFIHGMLGMTGFRLVNVPTLIPSYLHMMTGSPVLLGLGVSLQQLGGTISPILGAVQIEHRKRVLPVSMFLGTMMRVQLLGIALAGWFLPAEPRLILTLLFLFLWGLFSGPQGVAFQYLLAKGIPIVRRGRLQAWRNVFGGAVAAILSYFAGSYLLQHKVFGNGYATTFALAFALTSLGLTAFRLLFREPIPPTIRPKMPILARVREFPALLMRDRGFLYFMVSRTFAIAGRVAAPFFIVYATTVVTVSGQLIGLLSLVYLGADTLTNLAWGYTADKFGFKTTFVGALLFWIAAAALIMNAHTLPMIVAAFFLSGVANAGYLLSAQNMVLEFGHRDDIAMRLALSNTAENTTMAVGPLVLGAIIAGFGYRSIFVLSILLEATALVLMTWLVEDPRKRRRREAEAAEPSYDAIGESEAALEAELMEQTSASKEALDPEP
jgi:MFS family permease